MEFAKAIAAKAHEINMINMQVLEFDEELEAAEKATNEAIASGDEAKATEAARETRATIIGLGYADDEELPREN